MHKKKINFEALLSALVFFCVGALFIFSKGFYHNVYDRYIELPASPVREIVGIISVLLGTYVLLKFTNKKATETKANSVSELNNKETSESNEKLEEPSLKTSPFAKKDWGFVVLSVLKVPIILAFVFGGIYLVLFGAIYLITHLTN
jgi:hypothetical protein